MIANKALPLLFTISFGDERFMFRFYEDFPWSQAIQAYKKVTVVKLSAKS